MKPRIHFFRPFQSNLTMFAAGAILAMSLPASAQLSWDTDQVTGEAQGGTGGWLTAGNWWNGTTNVNWADSSNATLGGTAGRIQLNGTNGQTVSVGTLHFATEGYIIDLATAAPIPPFSNTSASRVDTDMNLTLTGLSGEVGTILNSSYRGGSRNLTLNLAAATTNWAGNIGAGSTGTDGTTGANGRMNVIVNGGTTLNLSGRLIIAASFGQPTLTVSNGSTLNLIGDTGSSAGGSNVLVSGSSILNLGDNQFTARGWTVDTGATVTTSGTGRMIINNINSHPNVAGILSGTLGLDVTVAPNAGNAINLRGNNTYTGGTNVSVGAILRAESNKALGNGPVTLSNAAGTAVLAINVPTTEIQTLNTSGAGAKQMVLGSAPVNLAGTWTSGQRLITLTSGNTSGLVLGQVVSDNNSQGMSVGTFITQINSATTFTVNTAPNTNRTNTAFGSAANVSTTLTIGASNLDSTFSGPIIESAGTASGLTKVGSGTLTLAGANTYTGNTTVDAGKLVVTESIGASAVSVSNAGTILATDTAASFGSTLAINAGAILAVGDAANATTATATATVTGATTFADASIFSWDINSTGLSYDKVVTPGVTDGGSAGGAVFRIVVADATFANPFWASNQSWTNIFTTNGSSPTSTTWATVFGSTVSVVNSGFASFTPSAGSFSLTGSTLSWTAVPEPTSAFAGLLLAASLMRRRRA